MWSSNATRRDGHRLRRNPSRGDVNPDAPVFVPRQQDTSSGSAEPLPPGEGQMPMIGVAPVPNTPELSPNPLNRFFRTSIPGVTGPMGCPTSYPMVMLQQHLNEATPANFAATTAARTAIPGTMYPLAAPVVAVPAMNQPLVQPVPVRTIGNNEGMNQPLVNQPMMNIPITRNIAMNTIPGSCYNPPSCLPLPPTSVLQPPVFQSSPFIPPHSVPPPSSVPPPPPAPPPVSPYVPSAPSFPPPQ